MGVFFWRQREEETKRLREGESTVNGQWSTVNGQWSKRQRVGEWERGRLSEIMGRLRKTRGRLGKIRGRLGKTRGREIKI